jgi:hypothetical protein
VTYESFETVFRVLHGFHLRPCDLARHREALDFFGLREGPLLAELSRQVPGEVPAGADDGAATDPQPLPVARVGLDGKVEPQESGQPQPETPLCDEAIIVTSTDERARVVAQAAKDLGLPYVRFQVIFAQGRAGDGDGSFRSSDDRVLPLQPVWATLGDHNNLLAFRRADYFDDNTPLPLHEHPVRLTRLRPDDGEPLPPEEQTGFSSTPGELLQFMSDHEMENVWYDSDDVAHYKAEPGPRGAVWLGLKVAAAKFKRRGERFVAERLKKKRLYKFLLPNPYDEEVIGEYPDLVALPGGGDNLGVQIPGALFHLDSNGGACFTAEEADAASRHLIAMGFLDHVQARMSTTPLLVPQKLKYQDMWCNEPQYSKTKVFEVSGVVRLAPLLAPLPAPQPVSEPALSPSPSEEECSDEDEEGEGTPSGSEDEDGQPNGDEEEAVSA